MLKLVSAPNDRGQSEKGYAVFFVNCPDGMNDRGYAASREEAIADFKALWDKFTHQRAR